MRQPGSSRQCSGPRSGARNDLHALCRRGSPLQRGRSNGQCFSPTQGCRKHNPGTRWRARPSWHGSWVLYSGMFINLAFPMTRLLTLVLQFFRFGTGACMGSTPSGGSRRERLPDHCVSVLAVQAPLTCAAMKRSLASSRDHSPLTSSCRGRSTRSGGGMCYVRPVWKASASIGFKGVLAIASASPRCRARSTR
jgi:hypothetical protein